MIEAVFWGAVAGSSLVIGALIAVLMRPRVRTVGLIMAFGAGTLIAAVAYDLIGKAIVEDASGGVALGFLAGAIVFLIGDTYVSARGAHNRKGMEPAGGEQEEEGSGAAITLGTVLDGVPESFVLGLALIGGADEAVGLIVAVFVSNVPEAIGATSSLQRSGWATSRIMLMWWDRADLDALDGARICGFRRSIRAHRRAIRGVRRRRNHRHAGDDDDAGGAPREWARGRRCDGGRVRLGRRDDGRVTRLAESQSSSCHTSASVTLHALVRSSSRA